MGLSTLGPADIACHDVCIGRDPSFAKAPEPGIGSTELAKTPVSVIWRAALRGAALLVCRGRRITFHQGQVDESPDGVGLGIDAAIGVRWQGERARPGVTDAVRANGESARPTDIATVAGRNVPPATVRNCRLLRRRPEGVSGPSRAVSLGAANSGRSRLKARGDVTAPIARGTRIHIAHGIANYRQRRFLFAGTPGALETLETVVVRQTSSTTSPAFG